jgi:hypothetical protein
MLSHPDSVIALGILRHQELQAESLRERRVMVAVSSRPAQPGVLNRMRTRAGSILIRVGTSLQVESREPGAPRKAFQAGIS